MFPQRRLWILGLLFYGLSTRHCRNSLLILETKLHNDGPWLEAKHVHATGICVDCPSNVFDEILHEIFLVASDAIKLHIKHKFNFCGTTLLFRSHGQLF